jgi:hypothetical protein
MTLGKIIIILGILFFSCTIQAQIECTDITIPAGIDHHFLGVSYMGGGAAFFDFDNDGDEDFWVAGGLNQDKLYMNLGDGSFSEIGFSAGLLVTQNTVTAGVVTGDLDNDGFRDVLVMPHIGFHPLLFKNNGNGTFQEFSVQAGLGNFVGQSFAVAFGDVNLDGFLDIYVATYVESISLIYDGSGSVIGFDHNCFDNLLFINNGDWTFSESGSAYGVQNGGCALAATFTDFDNDHDPDLLIANDFGEWITPNALYQNDFPSHTFTNISDTSGMDVGIYAMGIATGDFDRDLDLDYYFTNLGRNVLLENQGNLIFEDQTAEKGVEDIFMDSLLTAGWGTAFMDVDNDADLDLFVCNGYIPSSEFIDNHPKNRNRLFINDGNATGNGFIFSETAFDSGLDNEGRGRGFAYSDLDNDGDLDFLVINNNKQTTPDSIHHILLYRNDNNNGNNWLKVKLEGVVSNRDAFGSKIKIVVNGLSWLHEYDGGFGTHASQNSSTAHFGIGQATIVDSLIITWPTGEETIKTKIDANQFLTVIEDNPVSVNTLLSNHNLKLNAFPNPFSHSTQISFQLEKSGFVELDIFDSLGRKMETLNQGWMNAGKHSLNWIPKVNPDQGIWSLLRISHNNVFASLKLIHHN